MSKAAKSLVQTTADKIYNMIIKEHIFNPGDKLPNENELSEQLGISRATLRESVKVLSMQGILNVMRGKGTYVATDIEVFNDYGLGNFDKIKIRLKDLFMLAGLTLLMFMTRRQESMLVLLGSAVLATLITQLFTKYDEKGLKEFEDIAVSSLGTIAVVLLIVLLSVIEIKPKLDDKFVNPSTYPVDAAKYIKENLDVNSIKLFNEYNYGSYLLFEGIPVFIDSRADLYAPEFNGVKGKDGKYEGQDIFSDYINTSNISKYYENTFNTYGITHVILYKNSKLNIFLSRSDRYKELYSDKKFVIYERD